MDLLGRMPILARELTIAARTGRLSWVRLAYVWAMSAMAVCLFLVKWHETGASFGHADVRVVFRNAFLMMVGLHAVSCLAVIGISAASIAREKDRRTLDFLLATRLGNAEIVLSKLFSSLLLWIGIVASGLPIMVLMAGLGGIPPRLIVLMYGAILCMSFFFASIGVFASTAARNARSAAGAAIGYFAGLASGPLIVGWILPRFGLHLPSWLMAVNSWFLAGSPLILLMKLPSGISYASMLDIVLRMCGLQFLLSVVLLTIAIVRLRSAYRVNTGGDGRILGGVVRGRSRKIRNRPDVGDDPILWRERHTNRHQGVLKILDRGIWIAMAGLLACGTVYFGRPAVVEVWREGYNSGPISADRPEMNLYIRMFALSSSLGRMAADQSRLDFNIFLRLSALIVGALALVAGGFASESITMERSRETWLSLIATPLTGREILTSKLRASLWRIRLTLLTVAVLWTSGMAAGSLHPLGVVVASLQMAAWLWMMLACGLWAGILAKSPESGSQLGLGMLSLLTFTAILPYMVPPRFTSVFLGVASLPFDIWISLISYRDFRAATHFPNYPPLAWMGIATGEGVIPVIANSLVAILLPAIVGTWAWNRAVRDFDRSIGRPWKPATGTP